jgi:RimJ/RimL family protein N-acetyltransferase
LFAIEETSGEELCTKRLRLRPPRRSDLAKLDSAIRETLPDLIRWLPWARAGHSRQETRRYIRGARLLRSQRRAFEFLIEDANTEDLLGITSLHRIDWSRRCAGLGYWVRRSSWGGGIATESSLCLVDYAFRDLFLNRLEMHVDPENLASHRVAAKLGFRREGIAREVELISDVYRDHVQYSLLRSDVIKPAGGSR